MDVEGKRDIDECHYRPLACGDSFEPLYCSNARIEDCPGIIVGTYLGVEVLWSIVGFHVRRNVNPNYLSVEVERSVLS